MKVQLTKYFHRIRTHLRLMFRDNETWELEATIKGPSAYMVLWDFDQYLREIDKYTETGMVEAFKARQVLRELAEDQGVLFWNMP